MVLQTFEKIPQTLEKIEDGIVAWRDLNGNLAYSYITGGKDEEHIRKVYIKEKIDPRN